MLRLRCLFSVEVVLQDQAFAAEEQTLGVATLACCAQQVCLKFWCTMQHIFIKPV